MDPIVLAFGTALVGAIATSTWQKVSTAVTGLWRRARSQQRSGEIEAQLLELRKEIVRARREGDSDTEKALEGTWQVKVQQLLRAEPALVAELQRILDEVLTPALATAGQARIASILMSGSSHDSSTFTQIGTQTNYNRP